MDKSYQKNISSIHEEENSNKYADKNIITEINLKNSFISYNMENPNLFENFDEKFKNLNTNRKKNLQTLKGKKLSFIVKLFFLILFF